MILYQSQLPHIIYRTPPLLGADKLRYIAGVRLVVMAMSTNQKPTIYRNLYNNKDPIIEHEMYIGLAKTYRGYQYTCK